MNYTKYLTVAFLICQQVYGAGKPPIKINECIYEWTMRKTEQEEERWEYIDTLSRPESPKIHLPTVAPVKKEETKQEETDFEMESGSSSSSDSESSYVDSGSDDDDEEYVPFKKKEYQKSKKVALVRKRKKDTTKTKCPRCNIYCYGSIALLNHMRFHQSKQPILECPECGKQVRGANGIGPHMKVHRVGYRKYKENQ
jgi:hypothetical protein